MKPRKAFRIGLVLTGMALPALSADIDIRQQQAPAAKKKAICGETNRPKGLLSGLTDCPYSNDEVDGLNQD
jgi:hypothetical protein